MKLLRSERLSLRPLTSAGADDFHRLAVDPFVRHFLLDDTVVPRPWADDEIDRAHDLFDRTGLGMYLIVRDKGAPIGFAGFRIFEDLGPEPQLLYALLQTATGRGYATEAGRRLLEAATTAGHREIFAAIDAPNVDSQKVLERLDFQEFERRPGPFGETIKYRWTAPNDV